MNIGKNDALSVAYFFLKKAHDHNAQITNLKLQKLVYYASVWHAVFYNKKLFVEPIEAWIHGPAIPSLYRYFKRFGFCSIEVENIDKINLPFSQETLNFLNNIWEVYGKYDAAYLEALTHSELPCGPNPGLQSHRL